MNNRVILTMITALLMVLSCGRSSVSYDYYLIDEKSEDGTYHFSVDMTDSLASYNVHFYSRIDCSDTGMESLHDFPMYVVWTSPDSLRYAETVYFNVKDFVKGSDFYSKQYDFLYRKNLRPVKNGVWDLSVRIPSEESIKGFRGLGIAVEKN